MHTTPDDMLTAEQVAARLHIAKKTLDNWRYLGRGPAYIKDGGIIRYPLHGITAWIEKHEVVTC